MTTLLDRIHEDNILAQVYIALCFCKYESAPLYLLYRRMVSELIYHIYPPLPKLPTDKHKYPDRVSKYKKVEDTIVHILKSFK